MLNDGAVLRPRQALVIFSDRIDLAWLRVLKPGFRHCFAILESGRGRPGAAPDWVIYNPLSHCTEIAIVRELESQILVSHYRNQDLLVLQTGISQPIKRPVPWRPFTCVEALKRALGLRAARVFTPWQLYKFLK